MMKLGVSLLVVLGAGGVAAIVALFIVRTREWQASSFQRFANRVGLQVSDEIITAAVTRRLRRGATATAAGALISIVVVAVLWLVHLPVAPAVFIFAISLPLVLVGITAFPVVLALRDELYVHDARESRVARSMTVGVRDYISPLRFWGAPVFAALAVLLYILGWVLAATGRIDWARYGGSLALVAVVVVIVLLPLGWGAAQLVVRRTQTATDSLELAWSDAIRTETLRTLWLFETVIAWLAVVVIGLGILNALPVPLGADGTGAILNVSSVWGAIILNRFFLYGTAFSYFRSRLWPGGVGDVGEIIDESDSASADDSVEPEQRRP